MPSDTSDRVKVAVAGVEYSKWFEVEMDSDIFMPADAFSVRARAPGAQLVGAFREGMSCDVYVGDDRQMAGVIDDVVVEGTRSAETLALTGRDKGAFLVDGEAETIRAAKYSAKTLAEKLLKPSWGIKNVVFSNALNRKLLLGKKDRKSKAGTSRNAPVFADGFSPRAVTKVDPGQRVAQILDQHLRQLGLMWWLSAQGDLFIGKPDYEQEPSFYFYSFPPGDKRAVDNNVESYTVTRSIGERFSEIRVVGNTAATGTGANIFTGDSSKTGGSFKAAATDPDLVNRNIERRMILTDGDVANASQAKNRAEYEMGRRRLSALTIKITVPGFRGGRDGSRLYTIDTLATVRIPTAGIDGQFYVAQRKFIETRPKRRTELTLHEKGVFLP
ncbi:MAG TPA: hypothetical protein VKP14_10200 [Gaiellaceae bacterium]|nr:hypothetical protein [Gaiellaceae bacterium]